MEQMTRPPRAARAEVGQAAQKNGILVLPACRMARHPFASLAVSRNIRLKFERWFKF
jgi:hypothetical protein